MELCEVGWTGVCDSCRAAGVVGSGPEYSPGLCLSEHQLEGELDVAGVAGGGDDAEGAGLVEAVGAGDEGGGGCWLGAARSAEGGQSEFQDNIEFAFQAGGGRAGEGGACFRALGQ